MTRRPTLLFSSGMPAALLLLAGLLGCDDGGGGNPADVRGGAIGSACGGDDTYGCSPSRADQVVCDAGKWASAGACATGTQCHEVEDATGKLIGTTCRAASAVAVQRAAACTALAGCGYALSTTVCLRNSAPQVTAARIATEDRLPLDAAAQVVWPENETCLAQATSCAAVSACLLGGRVTSGCDASCDGQVALGCLGQDAARPLALNCAARGLSCQTHAGQAFCAMAGSCAGASGDTACNGNVVQYCGGGKATQVDCAKQNGTCTTGAGGAQCVGAGKGCTSNASTCDGNTLVRCVGNGEQRLDCAAKGLVCKAWSASQAECTAADAAGCTSADSCSGSQLLFCEAGKTVGRDCADVGATCGAKGLGFACLIK